MPAGEGATMASVLAIVSKALFEKMVPKDVAVGAVVDIDRYKSSNKAFDGLKEGGAVFLVTVRPPDEKLWLVGILESPKKKGDDWISASNTAPITDITASIKKLVFESGTGIKAKKGALGMSLQTPRVLTEDDVALLRGMLPKQAGGKKVSASAAYREAVEETVASSKKKGAPSSKKPAAKKADGGLRLERARQPFKGSVDDLEPWEKKQLSACVGGDKQLAAMFKGDIEEDWIEAWIVDVVDDATDDTKYQMHLFGYGDGQMFANETTKGVAGMCQHGFEAESLSKETVRQLAAAWKRDAKRLKLWAGHIDFSDDEGDDDDE